MEWSPLPEARLADAPGGRVPETDGWFIVNLTDAQGMRSERFGAGTVFESRERPFPEFGINVRLLEPGQPASLYHRENGQEVFLVLSGECLAIVEDEERPLRTGDLLYTPAGTAHVLVGAGEGPSVILMVGTRKGEIEVFFPVSPIAARYGASVERATADRAEAYAGISWPEPSRLDWPWPVTGRE